MKSFIDEKKIETLLKETRPDKKQVRDVIQKSLAKNRLELEEAAILLNAKGKDLWHEIFTAAKKLKQIVYGNRIVLFAPLYIGNLCRNDCFYCAFRRSNKEAKRKTLTDEEIEKEIKQLESHGHKRLILVFGEHPQYNADFIARCVEIAYAAKEGPGGEIRRVNINAAPMEVKEYKKLKKAGIGTFQVFQETYHLKTYEKYHPCGKKADFLWRLYGLDRAQEAGLDDVGIGALFGLYDWKFEALGLLSHTIHLEEKFNVGPHTISFPRVQRAQNVKLPDDCLVSNEDFKKLVAVIRLSVPYTGMILTARETPKLRREVIELGVSQIDAGSRIKLKGYSESGPEQEPGRQQFELGDTRPLASVMHELMSSNYVPSFCTACYRLGRTGEHFMEFALPGFIHNYCTPNAVLTLKEYLVDYASEENKRIGEQVIEKTIKNFPEKRKKQIRERLKQIEEGKRDLYF
jgi:2-iminoacetate synthase